MIETRSLQPGEARRRRGRSVSRTWVAAVVAVLVLAAAGCDTGADTSTGSPPTVTAGPETNEVGQEPNEVAAGSHTIPDKPGVYLFDLETREATRLPDIVTDWPWIIVSHNGTMIAYPGTDPDGRYVIDVADIDGTDIRSLESTAAPGSRPVAPDFSPDGSQIVYQLLPPRGPVGDLFVVDLATGKTTQLTHLPPVASDLWDMHPIFSPDGTTVLFNRPRFNRPGIVANQHWDLWSVPAARGEPRLVVRNAVDGRFSPDGRMIAYVEPTDPLHPFGGDLWLADADGTDVRRLERGKIVAPQWSPDGTKISYGDKGGLAYGDKGRHGSFVIDVATGVTTEVLGRHYRPEWVDGQTWIVVVCRGQCP